MSFTCSIHGWQNMAYSCPLCVRITANTNSIMENKTPNSQPEAEWKPFTAEDFDGLIRSGDRRLIASMGSEPNSLGSRVYEAIADAANARVQPLLEENARLREHFLECERVLAIAEKRGAELAAFKKKEMVRLDAWLKFSADTSGKLREQNARLWNERRMLLEENGNYEAGVAALEAECSRLRSFLRAENHGEICQFKAELAALKKEIEEAPVLYCDEAGNYFSTWSHDDYGVARTHTCRAVRRRPR